MTREQVSKFYVFAAKVTAAYAAAVAFWVLGTAISGDPIRETLGPAVAIYPLVIFGAALVHAFTMEEE